MKRIILSLNIIVLSIYCCNAQEELNFKIRYQPQTKYTQNTDWSLWMQKSQSGRDPWESNKADKMERFFTTGLVGAGDTMPITITYDRTTSAEKPIDLSTGTIVYGHVAGSRPVLDSIYGRDMLDTVKRQIFKALDSTFSELALSDNKLKVGESFSVERISPNREICDFVYVTKYTLTSIVDNIADFDIERTYKVIALHSVYDVKINGRASGQMQYNTEYQFCERYQLDEEIEFDFQRDGLVYNEKDKVSYTRTTEISKISDSNK